MKTLKDIASITSLMFLFACSNPILKDSSTLTIVPGVGISNVVAIGMSLNEMQSRNRDMKITISDDKEWFVATIPHLGVSLDGLYRSKRMPYFGFINFHIASTNNESSGKFNGTIRGISSTADLGNLTRNAVIVEFGEPKEMVLPNTTTNMTRYFQDGTSFSLHMKGEVMYFSPQGILFDIQDGVVTRVAVYPKEAGRTMTRTVP